VFLGGVGLITRGIDSHPALVIAGVLAGGEIAGVAGMCLSVPVIAGVRIVWRRLQANVNQGPARGPEDVDHPEPVAIR
jgi:predicted PurR-regulated permease PerM